MSEQWEWFNATSHHYYLDEKTAKRWASQYGGIARPMVIINDDSWDNHCQ